MTVTCLMLLATNQTMKIREKTWTPVTITDVRTIPVKAKIKAAGDDSSEMNVITFNYNETYRWHSVPPARQDTFKINAENLNLLYVLQQRTQKNTLVFHF